MSAATRAPGRSGGTDPTARSIPHKSTLAWPTRGGYPRALVSGILGILAGIVILVYPISSAVTLAFVGGIWLVILGVTQVIAGFELRSLGSHAAATTTPYDRPTSAV